MKYRKKPVLVNAWPISKLVGVPEFVLPAAVKNGIKDGHLQDIGDAMIAKTLEGDMRGGMDDFLIQGTRGEFYPCKGEIFAEIYEEVKGA